MEAHEVYKHGVKIGPYLVVAFKTGDLKETVNVGLIPCVWMAHRGALQTTDPLYEFLGDRKLLFQLLPEQALYFGILRTLAGTVVSIIIPNYGILTKCALPGLEVSHSSQLHHLSARTIKIQSRHTGLILEKIVNCDLDCHGPSTGY